MCADPWRSVAPVAARRTMVAPNRRKPPCRPRSLTLADWLGAKRSQKRDPNFGFLQHVNAGTKRTYSQKGEQMILTDTPLIAAEVSNRMTVKEVAKRLSRSRMAVYAMLEQKVLPGVRVGRRWIITRQAFERWERTCGVRGEAPVPIPDALRNGGLTLQ